MPRILFVASHRENRAPGQRYRFEQYFEPLREAGFDCDLSFLVSKTDDTFLYAKGNLARKAAFVSRSYFKRWADLRSIDKYDIVFIFREALMTGSTFFEQHCRKAGKRIIFDFDDAIWLHNISNHNRRFGWIKNANKTKELIGLSDLVIAGNRYLADYALRFNDNVEIVPTTIDTDRYTPRPPDERDYVCIGWTGSPTTVPHFQMAVPYLQRVKATFGNKVRFTLIGDASYTHEALGIRGLPWNSQSEVEDLRELDVGIMPLPCSEWAKGKCGCKGLEYMSLQIATVMSPVGVNTEIIQHGVNGFLASDSAEWDEKLSLLITNRDIRRAVGLRARETVERTYSVASQRDRYVTLFQNVATS